MRVFILVVAVMLSTIGAHASLSWLDTFETSTNNYGIPQDDFEAMLTSEYNVTVADNASRSLRLEATTQPLTLIRTGAETGVSSTIAGIRIWFYDNGEDRKAFELGIADTIDVNGTPTSRTLLIAVQDGQSATALGQYVMTSDGHSTPTGVARTIGWHFAEFHTNLAGSRLILDGVEYPNSHVAELVTAEQVLLSAQPIDVTSGARNAVWIDDVQYQQRTLPYYTDAGPWSDDFESGLSPRWFYGISPPAVSGQYNHSTDVGSSFSLQLSASLFGNSVTRTTELPGAEGIPAKLSFWFYDDGATTAGFILAADLASYESGPGKLRGKQIGIGAIDYFDSPVHEYFLIDGPTHHYSGLVRSTGWHLVEIETTNVGATVSLDGSVVENRVFPGYTRIVRADFSAVFSAGATATTNIWIDDVRYLRTGEPTAARDWTLYY